MKKQHIYELKRSAFFFILMVVTPIAILIFIIKKLYPTFKESNLIGNLILASILILTALILYAFLIKPYFHSKYIIDEKMLICKMGRFEKKVNIDQINYIVEGNFPSAGIRPALHTKGIIINYGNGYSIFLSPQNQKEFIATLMTSNSNIKFHNT